ncbi:O-antigen ligase family protein [Paraconexibacter sp.]|uniref:O-antigen ligase family protein n=1 Tax=Paraconexibacter sp. TaxID=2949640 RepID=UPI0035666BDD
MGSLALSRRPLSPVGIVLGLLGACFAILALQRLGATAIAAAAAAVLAVALLARPVAAVGTIATLVVLVEQDPGWATGVAERLYGRIAGFKAFPLEALLAVALVAVVADALHRHRLHGPGPFSAPLVVLGFAILAGVVTGSTGGADGTAILEGARTPLLLLLAPFASAHAFHRRRDLRRVLRWLTVVAAWKAVVGLLLLALAITPVAVNGERATYLESTANFVVMTFLLGVLAARVSSVPISKWAIAATPLAIACLLFSYRRSYWIATVACVVVIVLIATSPNTRRLLIPAVTVVVLALVVAFSNGSTVELSGPLGERVEQLSPSKVLANAEDRYRIGERKNVVAAVRESPLAGLGIGVPWRAVHPLSVEHPDGHLYSHVATLWFWMKFGLLGLIAYVGLILTAVLVGARIFRRHPDRMIAAAGLAGGVAILGLAIAETTATFIGAEPRMSLIVGLMLGLLAAADRDATAPRPVTLA